MRSAAARCAAAAMSSTPGSAAPTTAAPEHAEAEEAATVRPQRPYHEATRRPVAASSPNLSAESLLRLQALLQGLRTVSPASTKLSMKSGRKIESGDQSTSWI